MSEEKEVRRIAVAAEDLRGLDGPVGQHFGGSPAFLVAELDEKGVGKTEVVPNPNAGQHRPGFLPRFVVDLGAEAIIAGGMGEKARAVFQHHGLDVVTGMCGSIRDALEAYQRGERGDGSVCREQHGHQGRGGRGGRGSHGEHAGGGRPGCGGGHQHRHGPGSGR